MTDAWGEQVSPPPRTLRDGGWIPASADYSDATAAGRRSIPRVPAEPQHRVGRPPGPPPAAARASRAAGSSQRGGPAGHARGARRARLRLTRVDPWSVLKATFVFSACLLVVGEIAVIVLYTVLDVLGVFTSVEQTVHSALNITLPLSALGIIGGALLLGIVNVVLLSALATVASFIYNITAQMVGGIEVVLTEPQSSEGLPTPR